ncbi:MAG: LPS export ABC transporter permease LptG [Methylotenera sp.]|nr:LPS export ABC transporter permease LptG [Methylotenera sp.]
MNIISKYLFKQIAANIALIVLALMAMFAFFDLIEELESLGKGSYGLGKVLIFVLLSAPGHIYDVMPVAVLVGCMMSLGQLARHSELVVLRVSGISLFNIAILLLKIGAIFTVITFLIGELITPLSEKSAQRMRIQATDAVIAQDFMTGLWVKDGQSFINIEEVLPDTTLLNVHIYEFNQQAKLLLTRYAKSGEFKEDYWLLKDSTSTYFEGDKVRTHTLSTESWHSLIRPELLNVLLIAPDKMSAWNLYGYINHLFNNKQKTTRYEIALWAKLIYPLACLVMVVLALPFGFIQQRSGGANAKIFFGIMLGIVYQLLNRVFTHVGLLNDWPPFLSAIVPTLIFLMAGVAMLRYSEQR